MGTPQPPTAASSNGHVGAPGAGSPRTGRLRTGGLNWLILVAGVLLTALGLGLSAVGVALVLLDASQRDGRYIFTDTERLQTVGHAITTVPVTLDLDDDAAAVAGTFGLEDVISIQLRARPVIPDQRVFIGIADARDVRDYLEDVPHSVYDETLVEHGGSRAPEPPADQRIWEHSVIGTTQQTITLDVRSGDWVAVIMNADGTRPVWVDVQAGARTELFGLANPTVLIAGLASVAMGIPLVLLGAARLGLDIGGSGRGRGSDGYGYGDSGGAGTSSDRGTAPGVRVGDPLQLTGHLDPRLSRGMWLVKWLLVIPHLVVLAVLGLAANVVTVASALAILITGRYPRSWFVFVTAVMRWHWRVGFYAYASLGTDRYPPFALGPADYPADLELTYPERLSRGLVLVKWWLLAIPHLLIVGVITGGAVVAGGAFDGEYSTGPDASWGFSLLGLLVLIAAVHLLFTGRYPRGLFDLIMGLNRWVYRVATYVFLLRDEYPPFRLDQGATEPAAAPAAMPAADNAAVPGTGPAAASAVPRDERDGRDQRD